MSRYIADQHVPYFCTITVLDWLPVFVDSRYMEPMIESLRFCRTRKALLVFAYVIMPNHLHGIIALVERAERQTLGTVMQWYKTMTTNAYIRGAKEHGWPPFHERLWQRNYWEHIVRDDTDLARLRRYIEVNPARWMEDALHP